MSGVVFILGAGASCECGGPLMGNFLDRAQDLLWSGQVDKYKSDFDLVFKTISNLQAVHSKAELDLQNIESVFTSLELARVIRCLPGCPENSIDCDIIRVISSLKRVIAVTLEESIKFPLGQYNRVMAPSPYGEFVALLKQLRRDNSIKRAVSVITFNYDLAIDVALAQENMEPDYALFEPKVDDSKLQLLKLHGSLNWAKEKDSPLDPKEQIFPMFMEPFLKKNAVRVQEGSGETRLRTSAKLVDWFKENVGGKTVLPEPVIVPPSWNKADYHTALTNVWSVAAKRLSAASYIFVMGYSLPETDAFFRLLYALGSAGETPLRRFAVFNPEAKNGAVDTRFSRLLGPGARSRYEYHPLTFDKAISCVSDDFGYHTYSSIVE